ncbi:MAG: TIM barrel protein [Candidatus Lokiarchaeota archaeon]|nr:TIM barrel protein [Candidatus Lokiarchaeota archaeon]
MKIGLNTYSFRKELKKDQDFTLKNVWKIAEEIGEIEGIELLDRHIPGWPDGDLNKGVADVKEQVESFGWKLYALGPHVKMYKSNTTDRKKEIEKYKKWIDLCADNEIPQFRSQVGGNMSFFERNHPIKGVEIVSQLLDEVLPYANKRNIKVGIETHWQYSSNPKFLKMVTERYNDEFQDNLGIIFDWGNYITNKSRYKALKIAAKPQNHCHNHVKFFKFNENFQQTGKIGFRFGYSSQKIVKTFKDNNFKDYFSIEYEGRLSTTEGVYKSVYGLKYAIDDDIF